MQIYTIKIIIFVTTILIKIIYMFQNQRSFIGVKIFFYQKSSLNKSLKNKLILINLNETDQDTEK